MSWVAVAAAGGAIVSSVISSSASKSAASTQTKAGQAAIAEQAREFDISQQNLAPYRAEGQQGLSQLDQLFGPGGQLSKPFSFDISQDPGYQFRLGQGTQAIENSAAARGMQLSSANLKDLMRFGQDYASGEFNSAFQRDYATKNQLFSQAMGRTGLGVGATNVGVQAGQQTAQSIGNTMTSIGNAQAAGTIGAANAWSGGIQGGTNAFLLSQILNQNKPASTAQPSLGSALPGGLDPSMMAG